MSEQDKQQGKVLRFPDGFLWGAATSAHQVEGNNLHSDWWAWEKAGRVKDQSNLACDHYQRYETDFDIAQQLHHNAHRFSVEWARIEPRCGEFNEEALQHYVAVVDALRQRGLEPILTLHHFTTPQWVTEQGGWENPKVIDWFGRYTEHVVQALGAKVHYWMTINEPMVLCHMHYLDGVGPPGVRGVQSALQVTNHLVRAHALAYRIIHDRAAGVRGPVEVSLAQALVGFQPFRLWHPYDWVSTYLTDRVFNWNFLDAVTEGRWSVPGLARWRFPEAENTLDYLGFNYYTRFLIGGSIKRVWPGTYVVNPKAKLKTDMGWEVHPQTYTLLLKKASRYGRPILCTENGIATLDDTLRWRYLHDHLAALHQAIQEGVQVTGYMHWSLLDNFEWAEGFPKRFGMIEIDYATQKRTIKSSAHRLAEVYRTNQLALEE